MKQLLTSLLLLVTVTGFSQVGKYEWKQNKDAKLLYSVKSDTVKVPIPNYPNLYWKFSDLSDNKKVATLVGNTLYVHNSDSIKIVEQSHELRYLHWRGVTYRYQFAYIDKAFMYQHLKGGIAIW